MNRFTLIPIALLLASPNLYSQCPAEQELPANPSVDSFFGRSVGIDGNVAAVGAPRHGNAGTVFIFERSSFGWNLVFQHSGFSGDLLLGSAVSVDGVRVLAAQSNPRPVRVFERFGNTWAFVAALHPVGPTQGFAASLSFDDPWTMAGDPLVDDLGLNSGSVFVFERVGLQWLPTQRLLAADGDELDHFGRSVAVDRQRAAIGAPRDDPRGYESGSVYVFEYAGDEWQEAAKILPAEAETDELFGTAVALAGDTLLVGAPGNTDVAPDAGAVYVFEKDAGVWQEEAVLFASDASMGALFGSSVAISGARVIVGAPEEGGSEAGAAYLFERSHTGWTELTKLTPQSLGDGDLFGGSVSLAGGTAIVGASRHGSGERGAAFVFADDCNLNGESDACEILADPALDCNEDTFLDTCQLAANGDLLDRNGNGVLDECECFVSTYCIAAPNSASPEGARLSAQGIPSVGPAPLTLDVANAPVAQLGLFFYGPWQTQIVFGDGYRCVAGTIRRLVPAEHVDSQGRVSRVLNHARPPLDSVLAGDTFNFQFWYRDPTTVGYGWNLSDALEVTFCD